ncbi:MAG: hypothetical protein ACR2FS_11990 [Phormidesmis sp.]
MEDSLIPAQSDGYKLPVMVCPGFHDARLTAQWVRSLPPFAQPHVIEAFPANPLAVFEELVQIFGSPAAKQPDQMQPIVAVGFSAGVVGLAGALALWQQQGGRVAKLFALDGWGVPVVGLPVCRLSHDSFTHWSMLPLGAGEVNFYADPPVEHLQLWGEPARVNGWQVAGWQGEAAVPMTAADFLERSLRTEWIKQVEQSNTSRLHVPFP